MFLKKRKIFEVRRASFNFMKLWIKRFETNIILILIIAIIRNSGSLWLAHLLHIKSTHKSQMSWTISYLS